MLEDQIPVDELRSLYIKGNLSQRYRIARERLANPDHGPNLLVTAVAALEGFARAIAVKELVANGTALETAYAELQFTKPIALITDHVLPAHEVRPEDAFEACQWELLPEAVEFRNLLVHEATYLAGGTSRRLAAAAEHVFDRLAEIVGVRKT